jgi:hypothetical protein
MHTKFWSENLKRRYHLERLRRRLEDKIRMDVTEIGWEGVDCIHLAQDRDQWRAVVNTVNEPSVSIKGGEFLG